MCGTLFGSYYLVSTTIRTKYYHNEIATSRGAEGGTRSKFG